MSYFEHSIYTTAKSETIWRLWTNVKDWNTWDEELEYSYLKGPFSRGTKGRLKPVNAGEVIFELASVDHEIGFQSISFLPLCTLLINHSINNIENGLKITHTIDFKGLLAFFFKRIIGPKLKKGLPQAMQLLKQKAECSEKN